MAFFSRTAFSRAVVRWISVVALVAGTGGIVVAIGWPRLSELGFALVAGAMALSFWLPILAPLNFGGNGRVLDEFDLKLQTRAWLAACAAASFAAIIGMLLMLGLAMASNWERLALLLAMRSLLTYLVVLLTALPSLVVAQGQMLDEAD